MAKKCKTCEKEFTPKYSTTERHCSRECFNKDKKPNLKLKSLNTPKKKKCSECKEYFMPTGKYDNKVCDNVDCKVSYAINIVKKTKESNQRKYKKEMTIELMSPDKYRSKVLQPVINEIARLIDYNQPCIATNSYEGKQAGGHFIAVGSNRTICLNLHNIFIQSFHSNSWKGGDNLKYREGIIKTFSKDYLEFMENLQSHPKIGLSKNDMIEIYLNACKIRIKLRKNLKKRSSMERIELRNQINLELGIYEEKYCTFNH